MKNRKNVGLAGVIALTAALGFATAPIAAQQSGLVNVSVDNNQILNNVSVQVAANVAAQVCGIAAQVGVISQQLQRTGSFNCTNGTTGDTVQITRASVVQ